MDTAFFAPHRLYAHKSQRGSAGLFYVEFVGRAPQAFQDPSETLGVAFGWRRNLSATGVVEGMGSYTEQDLAGWREVPISGGLPGEADLDRLWQDLCAGPYGTDSSTQENEPDQEAYE